MPIETLLLAVLPIVLKPLADLAVTKLSEWYKRGGEYRKAVIAITKAVRNTDEYLSYLEEGGQRKRERELQLSVDWDIAGMSLGAIAETPEEEHLAERLRQVKTDAWKNRDKWSDEEIQEAGIDISTIRKKLEEYIEISDLEEN